MVTRMCLCTFCLGWYIRASKILEKWVADRDSFNSHAELLASYQDEREKADESWVRLATLAEETLERNLFAPGVV